MSADVVTLPVVYDPRGGRVTRFEQAREWAQDARCRLMAKTLDKSPIVVVRRTTLSRREINAFELGRECARYLRR